MEFHLLHESVEVEQTWVMSAEGFEKTALATPRMILYCEDARCLLEAFGETVQELVKIHERQFLAIMEGDSDAGRFDLLIHYANEKKLNAKYAYLHHLETHGCSHIDEIE